MVKFFYPLKHIVSLIPFIIMSCVVTFIILVEGFPGFIFFIFLGFIGFLGVVGLPFIFFRLNPEIEVQEQQFRLVMFMSKSNWYHQNQIIKVEIMKNFFYQKMAWIKIKEGEGKYKTFWILSSISNFDSLITYLQEKQSK